MPPELCPCGKPLHYANSSSRQIAEFLIRHKGPDATIVSRDGVWEIPVHYLVLHGVKSDELPALAAKYGFRRIGDSGLALLLALAPPEGSIVSKSSVIPPFPGASSDDRDKPPMQVV